MKKENKSPKLIKVLFIFIILLVGLFLYSRYLNTTGLKVNEIAIYDTKLNSDYNGLKIAQFSDLHYGRTTFEHDLKKLVKELNELNADIIIFTGDLHDSSKINAKDQELLTKYLTQIECNYKLAIIGDYDETYLATYNTILTNSNFILLDNSNKLIYHNSRAPLNFIGLTNTKELTALYENDYYNITLIHKPDEAPKINNTNLIFAGHSLGGQIRIPFIGGLRKINGATTYLDNYYKINDTQLYISNGIGTQDYSFRLFNKPSITLYRLYKS